MLRTGQQYRDSIRDGRRIWINGERVKDVTTHPQFKPLVDIRARIYDMAHEEATRDTMSYEENGERFSVGLKLPFTREDWHAKRAATNAVLEEVGGIVTRVGDETAGEMWSLFDGQDILNEVDPRFSENIRNHIHRVIMTDPFHVSANTDPKGDRSKRPQDQDPDMLLHVVRETDAGIVVRGAKYETAAAYANQAFTKPTIANWGDSALSEYAVGFVCDFSSPNLRFICRTGFTGRASAEDYPLANRFDEVDALVIYDDVLIPWENVLFYRHTRAAAFIRATLHRYSAFAFVQRNLKLADMMIGEYCNPGKMLCPTHPAETHQNWDPYRLNDAPWKQINAEEQSRLMELGYNSNYTLSWYAAYTEFVNRTDRRSGNKRPFHNDGSPNLRGPLRQSWMKASASLVPMIGTGRIDNDDQFIFQGKTYMNVKSLTDGPILMRYAPTNEIVWGRQDYSDWGPAIGRGGTIFSSRRDHDRKYGVIGFADGHVEVFEDKRGTNSGPRDGIFGHSVENGRIVYDDFEGQVFGGWLSTGETL